MLKLNIGSDTMKKKNTEKKISKKKLHNYLILGVIFLLGIGVVLYLCRWYEVYDEYQKEIPVIRGHLQEIVNEDLEHVILDNPTSIIYVCTSDRDNCRSFEKNFVKFLDQREIKNEIIYLNTTGIDQNSFINSFNEKYAKKKKLTANYPAFIYFEDGKVSNILQATNDKELTISRVEHFLELTQTGE